MGSEEASSVRLITALAGLTVISQPTMSGPAAKVSGEPPYS